MKQIEFVGGIAAELAEVLEENNIVATCIEGNVCEISDEDYTKLQEVAPAAFDGNDIITLTPVDWVTTLEELAQYINSNEDWQLETNDIISRNGWIDETGEEYGICSNGIAKAVFNEQGEAEVINI